jgi:hypothetical protein
MIDPNLLWAIYITFWIWFVYTIYSWFQRAVKEYQENLAAQETRLKKTFFLLKIEVANDQFLVYNVENGKFLLQASSLPELVTKFRDTYPSNHGVFVEGDQSLIDQLKIYVNQKETIQ